MINRRCIDSNRLYRRSRRAASERACCPVKSPGNLLLSNTTFQPHNVSGIRINDNHAGLEVPSILCLRDIFWILIYGVHLILDIHIDTGIDLIAAIVEHIRRLLFADAGAVLKVLNHILNDRIHIVRINHGSVSLLTGMFRQSKNLVFRFFRLP